MELVDLRTNPETLDLEDGEFEHFVERVAVFSGWVEHTEEDVVIFSARGAWGAREGWLDPFSQHFAESDHDDYELPWGGQAIGRGAEVRSDDHENGYALELDEEDSHWAVLTAEFSREEEGMFYLEYILEGVVVEVSFVVSSECRPGNVY